MLEPSTTEKVTCTEFETKSDFESDAINVVSSKPLSSAASLRQNSLSADQSSGAIKFDPTAAHCNELNDLHQIKESDDEYVDSTPNSQIDGKLLDQLRNITNFNNDSSSPNHTYTPSVASSNKIEPSSFSFLSDNANVIGCYGRPVKTLREKMEAGECDADMFDDVLKQIINDLKLDVYPRFVKSEMFDLYLRCRFLEKKTFSFASFQCLQKLGRGAFGLVSACKKKDTGKLYAMKQIDKRRCQATDSVQALISEKDFLSRMDSIFVTSLKYAFTTDDKLYLIMDLMTGGDLKFHLNNCGLFEESRVRFYAAQILLGLEHIHGRGIIYRDLKLENVLVDARGHIKISDLGLATLITDAPRGYAGTPGYTAPEVVLPQHYDEKVDFFSLGVMIYRTLCGKKPFAKKGSSGHRTADRREREKKSSNALDHNVVEMIPPFDSEVFNAITKNICRGLLCKSPKNRLGANGFAEIKEHPWFDCIDWALMESGHLVSPFIPRPHKVDKNHSYDGEDGVPGDDKYSTINITNEFERSLHSFPFKSSKVIQSEIVDVLECVYADRKRAVDEDGSMASSDLNAIFAFPSPCVVQVVPKKRHCLSGCVIV